MSVSPQPPARAGFSDAQAQTDVTHAPGSGNADHPQAGCQAEKAFLRRHQLPQRWAGRPRFVVLETNFGLGHHFLATWAAWRADPQRCRQLVFVSIAPRGQSQADLHQAHRGSPQPALAQALMAQWPPTTPDIHLLDFDGGAVRLLLALGDVAQVLPDLVLQADAVYLGEGPGQASDIDSGAGPDRPPVRPHPRLLRHLQRLAAAGCTVASAHGDSGLRQALTSTGFVLDAPTDAARTDGPVTGHYAPRHHSQAPPGRQGQAGVRHVAVVGAGLAGAAVARALAHQGLQVTVLERLAAPAQATSGNAGGLFHSVLHPQDGAHARWLRAAALHTQRVLAPLQGDAGPRLPGALHGLLRGEATLSSADMDALLQASAQPPAHVQRWAHTLPGGRPAWLYPGGGWVSPADLVVHWLASPGITTRCGQAVERLLPSTHGSGWQLLDAQGQALLQADAVVLCNAHDALRLLGEPGWPLQRVRGQTTLLPADTPGLANLPLDRPRADQGYALRLADGRVLCGAVAQPGDDEPALRAADHATHLDHLRRLTGWAGTVDAATLDGRVGWRLSADDKLPLLGPVPAVPAAGSKPITQVRFMPRVPGLWLFTALGSRGITQAALGGELLAAWLTNSPSPVPAALIDALDPARFEVRAARQAESAAPAPPR